MSRFMQEREWKVLVETKWIAVPYDLHRRTLMSPYKVIWGCPTSFFFASATSFLIHLAARISQSFDPNRRTFRGACLHTCRTPGSNGHVADVIEWGARRSAVSSSNPYPSLTTPDDSRFSSGLAGQPVRASKYHSV